MRGQCWVGAVVVVGGLLAACSDDDASDITLSQLGTTPGGSSPGATTAPGDPPASATTALAPGVAGAGFVSIQVILPAAGVDETLALDRATVSADKLDPVSLDASCTPLDGGTEMAVSVVDLRRLAAGSRVISAALRVEGGVTAGEHDATLEVSGADQVTTTFNRTVELAEGGWSGTFEVTDSAGNTASGTFACAAEPIAPPPTPVPASDGGEEVPESAPATSAPATSDESDDD